MNSCLNKSTALLYLFKYSSLVSNTSKATPSFPAVFIKCLSLNFIELILDTLFFKSLIFFNNSEEVVFCELNITFLFGI